MNFLSWMSNLTYIPMCTREVNNAFMYFRELW